MQGQSKGIKMNKELIMEAQLLETKWAKMGIKVDCLYSQRLKSGGNHWLKKQELPFRGKFTTIESINKSGPRYSSEVFQRICKAAEEIGEINE